MVAVVVVVLDKLTNGAFQVPRIVVVFTRSRVAVLSKLRHSGPIRPQDVGNAVRSSPII